MNKIIFVLPAILLLVVPNVYAGGPRHDYDEKYPEYADCWTDGWDDGQDHPFDHDRNDECKGEDKGNQYYRAFIFGCMDAGNTKEICEKFTDA